MENVTVLKTDLIRKITENRREHQTTFLRAQKVYRSAVIEELDRMLADAREGRPIKRAITLPQPEEHTKDYDQALAMLEMSVDEHITLTYHQFAQFVLDDWGWKSAFTANTANYLNSKD